MDKSKIGNLSIVNLTLDSLQNYISCFEENGNSKNEKHIKWQFLENPVNKQYVDIAIDEENNKTAAIYAIAPVYFKVSNQVFVGSQSLDTITGVDYRGQGLFIKLAKDVYQKAAEDKIKLVYGFPNGSSIYGFSKKLGWEVLDPVPFLVKPLQTKYFTAKVKVLSWFPNINISKTYGLSKDFKIVLKNEFPQEVDGIWSKFSTDIEVAVNRDKKYLDWRYIDKPLEGYAIEHIYKNDEYLGYIVYCIKEKHGGVIAYIMELIYNPEYPDAGSALLKSACNTIKEQNADCILSWCLPHSLNYPIFSRLGFYTMPEKLRPIELHFGAKSFDDQYNTVIGKRENWYLSYSDSDTV